MNVEHYAYRVSLNNDATCKTMTFRPEDLQRMAEACAEKANSKLAAWHIETQHAEKCTVVWLIVEFDGGDEWEEELG